MNAAAHFLHYGIEFLLRSCLHDNVAPTVSAIACFAYEITLLHIEDKCCIRVRSPNLIELVFINFGNNTLDG